MKKKDGGFKVIQDLKELLGIDAPGVGETDDLDGLEEIENTGIIEVNTGKETETPVSKDNSTVGQGASYVRGNNNVSNLESEINAAGNYQTIFVDPKTFSDCKKIATYIKNDKMVTLNLEYLDLPTAQRLMDFLAGAMSIKGASFIEISKKVYTAVPKSMKVYYEGRKDTRGRTILDFGREEK